MDNKNVIFGRVISGMNFLLKINQLETVNERPSDPVKIIDCGVFTL
jgi:peptidyl-prolyl isomerase G (cyclophilin G)